MTPPSALILPGSTVLVKDSRSIYNGYKGFVQRISGDKAAVLFEGGNWDERTKYGGDGIGFIEEMFEKTHYVGRSYNAQGSVILFPVTKEMSDNVLVGSVEE